MNEAEARAYVTERLRLSAPCRFDGQILSGLDPCPGCGVRASVTEFVHKRVARDWHVWEDLRPAMKAEGWRWYLAEEDEWEFWREGGRLRGRHINPIIAAALALRAWEAAGIPRPQEVVMPKIKADLRPHPREWSLLGCQEYLMGLAVPCPSCGGAGVYAQSGARQGAGFAPPSCGQCDGTGKVYPLRMLCVEAYANRTYLPSEHRHCKGECLVPVEPSLETLRAAALQAGFWHGSVAELGAVVLLAQGQGGVLFGHRFFSPPSSSRWVYGFEDLLTCARALCVALLEKETSGERG